MELAEKLRYHRNIIGLSQQQVADQLNISRQSVSKWENGRGYPDIDNLVRLSDIYKVSIDELLKENDELRKKIFANEEEIASKQKELSKIEKIIGQNLAGIQDEGVILLILALLSCLIFPLGFFLAPFVAYRNKRTNTFHKIVYVVCICSLLINLYNAFVYYSLWFEPGITNVDFVE